MMIQDQDAKAVQKKKTNRVAASLDNLKSAASVRDESHIWNENWNIWNESQNKFKEI